MTTGKPKALSPDLKALQALADWLDTTTLEEVELEQNGIRMRLKKPSLGVPAGMAVVATPTAAPVHTAAEAAPSAGTFASPMVGTFYRSPSPDAPSFVNEGDMVKEGQTLCIIEAMKTMNQIAADRAGRVVKIIAQNAQPVEFGQPLFVIE